MENYLISPNPSSLTELTPNQAAFVGGLLGTVLTVSLIIGVLLIIAGWKIFEKAGEKGWKILIPIYDIYIFFKICGLKNWFWAAFCITVIGSIMIGANMPPMVQDAYGNYVIDSDVDLTQYPAFIAGIIICSVTEIIAIVAIAIKLAKAFGKGVGYALGLIFLTNIFALILGFGKAKYSKKNLEA